MAVSAIDTTVGGATSNSYASVAEIDQQMEDRLYTSAWGNATADEQAQGTLWSTQLLDQLVSWYGVIASETQALGWPRVGATDCESRAIDTDVVPDPIKEAQGELALWLLKGDKTSSPEYLELGISKAAAGPLSVEFDKLSVASIFSDTVLAALQCYGAVSGLATAGGIGNGIVLRG